MKVEEAYQQLKSKVLKRKLFEEFILEDVLIDVGQKRQRLVAFGEAGENDERVKAIDKSERKRQKKEQ